MIRIAELGREPGPGRKAAVMAASLATGLVGASALFLASGVDPLLALASIFRSSFGSAYGLGETVSKAIPLAIIAIGLCLPFRGKFWNIGAESQFVMGALASTWAGLTLAPGLPPFAGAALALALGLVAGALWGIVPALLKTKFGVNEVISTLMLNYIANEFIVFLVVGPFKGATKSGYPYTDDIPSSLWLQAIPGTRIYYLSLVAALLLALAFYFISARSKLGYEVRVMGENREAARYAGIDFVKATVAAMAISGGVAGLAGGLEILGTHHHMTYPQSISAGYGFTAIIVAWLARLNPVAALGSAFFFAGMLVGGDAIQMDMRLPAATMGVFNGVLLVFFIAGDFFLTNRIAFGRGERR